MSAIGDGGGAGRGKAGRKLSYVATIQGNGNLLVGKAYTAILGLEPGDEFEVKLGRKQIKLIPAGAVEEELSNGEAFAAGHHGPSQETTPLPMPIHTDLTDTLLAMIPEDGRRMGNDEIRAALEREAEEAFSDAELEEAKIHVVAIGEAEKARGPGGGLKKRGMSAPPRAAVASAPQIAIATGTTAASVLTCLLSICRLDELEALERAAL